MKSLGIELTVIFALRDSPRFQGWNGSEEPGVAPIKQPMSVFFGHFEWSGRAPASPCFRSEFVAAKNQDAFGIIFLLTT
jgi:hypothetical protein